MVADPINVFTGNTYQEVVDYRGTGMYPLNFIRHYNSNPWTGSKSWRHNYQWDVHWRIDFNDFPSSTATVVRADGSTILYKLVQYPSRDPGGYYSGTFVWKSDQDPAGKLFSSGSVDTAQSAGDMSFEYTSRDNVMYVLPQATGTRGFEQPSTVFGDVRLSSIVFPSGFTQSVNYGSSSFKNPVSVSDSFGRRIGFRWTRPEAIDAIEPPDFTDRGRLITFSHYSSGDDWDVLSRTDNFLPNYISGDVFTEHYRYGESGRAPASLPHLLTSIVNEGSEIRASYSYDSSGRAYHTEAEGGLERSTLQFNDDGSTTVTNANGAYRYLVSKRNGIAYNAGVSQPAGSGCAESASKVLYDAKGEVEGEEDFNGNRTCIGREESRRLEVVKVVGLPGGQAQPSCEAVLVNGAELPPGARKTTTQWHANWVLPSKIASPGRHTTFVRNGEYDPVQMTTANCIRNVNFLDPLYGISEAYRILSATQTVQLKRPMICKIIEEATTDMTGQLGLAATLDSSVERRIWAYTYNDAGQITSSTDNSGTGDSSFVYYVDTAEHSWASLSVPGFYRRGDMKVSSNKAGHVTKYESYDNSGRVLRLIDRNLIQVDYSYSGRGLLEEIKVDGQVKATMTHDRVGRPKRTTAADGSWFEHVYDAASRRTATFDNRGNRVEHRLDLAGNPEETKLTGSDGVVRRRVTREFDDLGRVERITGRE